MLKLVPIEEWPRSVSADQVEYGNGVPDRGPVFRPGWTRAANECTKLGEYRLRPTTGSPWPKPPRNRHSSVSSAVCQPDDARTVPGLPSLGLAGRDDRAVPVCRGRAPRAGPPRDAGAARDLQASAMRACRLKSPSSTGSSAAASCQVRSYCSAAIPASANRHSLLQRPPTSPAPARLVLYVSGEESAEQIKLRARPDALGRRHVACPDRDRHRRDPGERQSTRTRLADHRLDPDHVARGLNRRRAVSPGPRIGGAS